MKRSEILAATPFSANTIDPLGLVGMFPPGGKCSPCKGGKDMEKDDAGIRCCPEDLKTSKKGLKLCGKPRNDDGKEQGTDWAPPQALIDLAGGFVFSDSEAVNQSSLANNIGNVVGVGLTALNATAGVARVGAQVSIALRGTSVGKYLNQGRYWRVGASGAKQRPTLRIGAARPPTKFNHIDLKPFDF